MHILGQRFPQPQQLRPESCGCRRKVSPAAWRLHPCRSSGSSGERSIRRCCGQHGAHRTDVAALKQRGEQACAAGGRHRHRSEKIALAMQRACKSGVWCGTTRRQPHLSGHCPPGLYSLCSRDTSLHFTVAFQSGRRRSRVCVRVTYSRAVPSVAQIDTSCVCATRSHIEPLQGTLQGA